MLLVALSCVSCASGDGDGKASESATAAGSADTRDEETTTTVAPDEPSAAQPDEVIPYIEDLLARYDEAVNDIVADPSIAQDTGNPTVEEFLSLFDAGNEFATGSLEGWTSQAEQGITLRPASPDHGVNTTSLEGPPTRIDDDTILFGQCTVQSYVVVEDGAETRREDRKLLPGSGQAVRVDGHWLLQEITTPPDAQGCITHGGVQGGEPG
jgi:hypothetical protein